MLEVLIMLDVHTRVFCASVEKMTFEKITVLEVLIQSTRVYVVLEVNTRVLYESVGEQ